MENHFKVGTDDEGDLEIVLLTVESHKGICFRHIYPHHFVVCTISEVLVPGPFAGKSLEIVQTEVLLVVMLAVTTSEQSTQILDCGIVPLLIPNY